MSELWEAVNRHCPRVSLKVYTYNPRNRPKPGRIYRWKGALFFSMDDDYALVLPDDMIANMVKAGLLKKGVLRKRKAQ